MSSTVRNERIAVGRRVRLASGAPARLAAVAAFALGLGLCSPRAGSGEAANPPAAKAGGEILRAQCFRLVASGYPTDAISTCSKAIESAPGDPEGYSNRGSAYVYLRRFNEAVADFTSAIGLSPGNGTHYFNRGLAYEGQNDTHHARSDYDEAIRLMPAMSAAYFNRAQLLRRMGEREQAISDYRKAAALDPGYNELAAEGLLLLGAAP